MGAYSLIEAHKVGGGFVLHVEYQPGGIDRLLGEKKHDRLFRGSCTVWHDAKTGKRASTSEEYQLAEIAAKVQWELDDTGRLAESG